MAGSDDAQPAGTHIFAQRLDGSTGAEIGANDFRVNQGPTGTYPCVVWNSVANEYLVAWRRPDDIFGQRISAAGVVLSAVDVQISATAGASELAESPAAAFNHATNRYHVVWQGRDLVEGKTVNEIFARALDGDATRSASMNE